MHGFQLRFTVRFLLPILCLLGLLSGAYAQSSRFPGQLGAMVYDGGVTFRTWAPNASSVAVAGDFNSWSDSASLMVKEAHNDYWSVDVDGANVGDHYQFVIDGTLWRRDPRSRQVENSSGNSIVYDPSSFDWGDTPIPMPWRNDLVFYQMHIGTFGGVDGVATFDDAIPRLDHVQDLGITAIKLMPVNEFAGDYSWGYNPADLFAIESAYGGPEAMKRFMKAAHERGIAVVLDIVHNHYGPTDLDLWEFDGDDWGPGGIYFYNDWRAETPWGDTRPHFGREEVRRFIRDSVFMFIEDYRIGGFRWDSVYNIINVGWDTNPEGWHMLRDINWEMSQSHPHVIRGAEDHYADHPMNFEHQWDVAQFWNLHSLLTEPSDANRDMNSLLWFLYGDHYLHGHNRLIYTEAHDYIAKIRDGRSRMPEMIDWGDPESIWAQRRSLLGAGLIMTAPGLPMIHQGQEMLETIGFHDDQPLRWERADDFAGIVRAYRDLIRARRNLRGGMQGLKGVGIHAHHVNHADKVVGYVRWDQGNQTDDVVVAVNFSGTPRIGYSFPFPSHGTWHSHYNSDSSSYSDDFTDVGTPAVDVNGPEALIDMGPYSIQIFSLEEPGEGPPVAGTATVNPESPSGCENIAISYQAGEGPLEGASEVALHIGRNGWLDVDTIPMELSEGTWTASYQILPGTETLNFVFNNNDPDDESRIWDNNLGQDWGVAVSGCGWTAGLSAVWTDPESPEGCDPISIYYDATDRILASASPVYIHLGFNGWNDVVSAAMTDEGNGVWSYVVDPAFGTSEINLVFNDGNADEEARVWDNRYGLDWSIQVQDCVVPPSGLAITNPATDISVEYSVATYTLEGIAENVTVSDLTWTNLLTGDAGTFPVADPWSLSDVPLAVGPNTIIVSTGENGAMGIETTVGFDHAANYSGSWGDGVTAGSGFGVWQVWSDGDDSGTYIGDSTEYGHGDVNMEDVAFGLYGHSEEWVSAQRGIVTWGDQHQFSIELAVQWRSGDRGINFYNTSTLEDMDGPTEIWNFHIDDDGYGETDFDYHSDIILQISARQVGDDLRIEVIGTSENDDWFGYWTTVIEDEQLGGFRLYTGGDHDSEGERNFFANRLRIAQVEEPADGTWDSVTITREPEYIDPTPIGLFITTPAGNTNVAPGLMTFDLGGTARGLIGDIQWQNSLSGASGSFAAEHTWTLPGLALATGTNVITLTGFREGLGEGGIVAEDHAGNYGGDWLDDSNAGSGFAAWGLASTGEQAGHFISEQGFGFWSHEGDNLAEAFRGFSALGVGQTFHIRFRNGWIWEEEGSVGFALRHDGDVVWEFYFNGGDDTYSITDHDSEIGWTGSGLNISFTVVAAGEYEVIVDPDGSEPSTFTGSFSGEINNLRAWSANNGTNDGENHERDFFINNLLITDGEGAQPVSASVVITRASTGGTDSNGDGIPDDWYLQHGLNPHTAGIADQVGANGYTHRQSYWMNVDPHNPNTAIRIEMNGAGQAMIQAPGGSRRYRIQHAETLADEFVDVDPDQRLPAGSTIDMGETGQWGFYRARFLLSHE